MSLDVEADRTQYFDGQTAAANMNIYFLAHAPLADMNKSYA